MKENKFKIAGILFLVLAAAFTSCKQSANQNGVGGTIPADEFEKKLAATENAQIADVRTPGEYSEGHIKNALNINWNGDSFEADIQKMDKNKPVFVYCLSGGRSSSAVSKMVALGFKEIYELDGGMRAWYNGNKPVDTGSAATTQEKAQGMSLVEYEQALKTDKLVLVDFNAVWCAPCKQMSPWLDEIATEMKDKVTVLKLDVEENKQIADMLQIENLPTLLLYKNGKVVWNGEGLTLKDVIVDAINKN
ncbi:MAG: thioredoxin domain-containing protein [Bacteroidia bacterium]|nr:thioredoxin domain-containing protein [Bacteroidia bacterium]